jgi:hypothetical protein
VEIREYGYARTGWLNEEWDTLSRCLMGIASTHGCGDLDIGGGPLWCTPVPKLAYININISSAILGLFVVVVLATVESCTSGQRVNVFLVCSSPRMRVPFPQWAHWS